MYFELVENSIYNRGNIVKRNEMSIYTRPFEAYVSMFGFDKGILQWVKHTEQKEGKPTVSGYNGNYFCNVIFLDIDNEEDRRQSHIRAKELLDLLYQKAGVTPQEVNIYFSGNKGFHIALHQNLFGGIAPGKDVPAKILVLVSKLLAFLYDTTLRAIDQATQGKKKKNFNDIDVGIYNQNRIFRLPNSLHNITSLYKIGLTSDQLYSLDIDEIMALATQPVSYKPEVPHSRLQPNAILSQLWKEALSFNFSEYHKEEHQKESHHSTFFGPVEKGNRNSDLFRQAAMLFDTSTLSEESVRQIIAAINLSCTPPLPEKEIQNLVRSAAQRTARNQRVKEEEQQKNDVQLETFEDWLDEWYEHYTADKKKLTCIFDDIDRDQEHHYIGKLACFIGTGGTRKSYAVQNVLVQNIINNNAIVACSSMEMGKVEVVNRLIDILSDPYEYNGYKISASRYLSQVIRTAPPEYFQKIRQLFKHIDEKLILDNRSFRTFEDYDIWIQRITEIHGKPDILIVDGLSMMGGKGNETENYSQNTAELKELAKKHDLFIPLICHTTKESKEYIRDSRRFVRGSEKILDNSDFTICFSNLIDPYKSTPENIEFAPEVGHMKYYNKRGTGKTINKIFHFDGLTKRMNESTQDPKDFPEYSEFVSNFSREQNKKNKKINDGLPF